MKRVLFFGNSPELSASMRFFVNVPIFLALAAGLLLWMGGSALDSRWTPAVLALTHLLTLGVMASAMIGAILQILPVASSVYVAGTRLTATVVHIALTSGTLLLAVGFMTNHPLPAQTAAVLLAVAFGWFLAAVVRGVLAHRHTRTMGSEPLFRSVQLALLALLLTIALGLALLGVRAWGARLSVPGLTDVHAAWGLLGWVGLLLSGVTFKVIPVFQSTELYPRTIMHLLAPAIFTLLAIWSALVIWLPYNVRWPAIATGLLLALAYATYAMVSLRLLHNRKRPASDTTTRFWRVTMCSAVACLPVWLWLQLDADPRNAITLGVLMIFGIAVSAINGMLYKILPVLLWNHTQMPLQAASPLVPKIKEILPDTLGTTQFRLHLVALLLLVLASRWPWAFTHPAALAALASSLWLGRNIMTALGVYRHAKKQIALSQHQP